MKEGWANDVLNWKCPYCGGWVCCGVLDQERHKENCAYNPKNEETEQSTKIKRWQERNGK